jgi:L-alanine-DL-glutamate epimerase-like enolase superfamily enzyme
MNITAVTSRVARIPLKQRIVSNSGVFAEMWFLLVDLATDEGISGQTYLWAYSAAGAQALQGVLRELAEVAVGEDPFFSARLWRKMWRRTSQWGHAGLAVNGLAGIDTAVWDIVGKALGKPLAQVLGAHAERVPTYASGGLWVTEDLTALAQEAEGLATRGYRAMKMRLGRQRANDDIAAVRAVREAVGPDVDLMVDVNQGWTVDYTIRVGRQLEVYNLYWLEEPVPHDDLDGHAKIAAALDTPIASGEKVYTSQGFREVLERQAFDILMADVQRVGGVTGWMRVAALAEAWNLPICSHLFPEINVHLVAAAPTACYLETMPWLDEYVEQPAELVDGQMLVPGRPGLGLSWDECALRRVLVE